MNLETEGTMPKKTEKRERGSGRIFKMKGSLNWWVQFYDHGHQVRESAGSDNENVAKRLLRKRLGEVEAGIQRDSRGLRYENLRDNYLREYLVNGRKSLRRDREGKPYLDKVKRLDGYFAGFRVSEIGPDEIRKFVAGQQKGKLTAGSINRSLAALKRMFRLALRDGKLRNVPYIPMLKEAAPRSGFFEPEEFESLYKALPADLRLPLALGYYTGMRRAEVCGLRWEQVDFLGNSISLNAGETKNDQGRTIPIVPQLLPLLKEQYSKRQADCPLVCFRLNSKGRAIRVGDFRKVWQARCIELGLGKMVQDTDPLTDEPLLAGEKAIMVYKGKLYHDLRRSAVRNLVRAGVPERVAQEITGHKTRSVFARYNIVSAADVVDAGRKLGAFIESKQVGASSGQASTGKQQSEVTTN